MYYVADTHALIWYLTNSDKLPLKVKQVFESITREDNIIVVPLIVLCEILYISEKKKVAVEFGKIASDLEAGKNYVVSPLDMNILKIIIDLKTIKEMHDRIIVATTQFFNATLITKDPDIIASKLVETIWE